MGSEMCIRDRSASIVVTGYPSHRCSGFHTQNGCLCTANTTRSKEVAYKIKTQPCSAKRPMRRRSFISDWAGLPLGRDTSMCPKGSKKHCMQTNRITKRIMPQTIANNKSNGSRSYLMDDDAPVHSERRYCHPLARLFAWTAPDKKKHADVTRWIVSHQLSHTSDENSQVGRLSG